MAVWGPFAVQAFRDGLFRVLRFGKTRSRPASAQPADLGVYDYAPAPLPAAKQRWECLHMQLGGRPRSRCSSRPKDVHTENHAAPSALWVLTVVWL